MNRVELMQKIQRHMELNPHEVLDIFNQVSGGRRWPDATLLFGFKNEMEHIVTVKYDLKLLAGIVVDHLREHPDYYKRLARAGL
jgi:hypothetical protein